MLTGDDIRVAVRPPRHNDGALACGAGAAADAVCGVRADADLAQPVYADPFALGGSDADGRSQRIVAESVPAV